VLFRRVKIEKRMRLEIVLAGIMGGDGEIMIREIV